MHIFFFFIRFFRVPERKTLIFGVFSVGVLSCFARAFIGRNPNIRVRRLRFICYGKSIGVLHAVQFCTIILRTIFRRPGTHPIIRGHRVFFFRIRIHFVFSLFFYSGTISAIQLYHIRIYYNIKKCRLIDINKICTAAECENANILLTKYKFPFIITK